MIYSRGKGASIYIYIKPDIDNANLLVLSECEIFFANPFGPDFQLLYRISVQLEVFDKALLVLPSHTFW